MKSILALATCLVFSFSVNAAETKRKDPNLNKTTSNATAIAPGCTEFVHPCSGQAATALLNSITTPISKVSLPIPAASSSKGGRVK